MIHIFRKYSFLTFSAAVLAIAGCSTIPAGRVGEGPIIADSASAQKIPDADEAVNHMLVSLVMKCPPFANAGRERPKIENDFTFSSRRVDYMQMSLWWKLIKMKMLRPATSSSGDARFRLVSVIKHLGAGTDTDKQRYIWHMKLCRVKDAREIWSDKIEFEK